MKPHLDRRSTDAKRFCGFFDAEFFNIAQLKDLAVNCGEADHCFPKHLANLLPLHSFRRNFAPIAEQSRRYNSSIIGRIVK